MKLDTAIANKNSAIIALADAYSVARMCHLTSEQLNQKVQEIVSLHLIGCPRWAHAEFEGYRRALNDMLYRHSLVFGGYVDGTFYSTHRSRADYYEHNGISPSDYADNGRVKDRGHYWADDPSKPFFTE